MKAARIRRQLLVRIASLEVGAAGVPTVTCEQAGSCVGKCEEVDIAHGAPAAARVVMDDAAHDPDGFFGLESLIDFGTSVGRSMSNWRRPRRFVFRPRGASFWRAARAFGFAAAPKKPTANALRPEFRPHLAKAIRTSQAVSNAVWRAALSVW